MHMEYIGHILWLHSLNHWVQHNCSFSISPLRHVAASAPLCREFVLTFRPLSRAYPVRLRKATRLNGNQSCHSHSWAPRTAPHTSRSTHFTGPGSKPPKPVFVAALLCSAGRNRIIWLGISIMLFRPADGQQWLRSIRPKSQRSLTDVLPWLFRQVSLSHI